ncbi:reverse transcriptase domain-containing protein [Tanacetum coccineum]|uniref:Reverse transcriptase domain-containing protein n=1 Tax=Tanacetum coccineum TaxID=301880 RepID=A0ABQ5EDF2_9ASTR
MAKEDEEKTTFITCQGVFCYSKMPFGLRNAGETYQRLMEKSFHKQIGRNLKVYVDDLVIKRHTEDEIIRDIKEKFKTLREINMKLNPKKCTFEGMFLGYKVNTKGIKVCLNKVDDFLSLSSPKCLKDVQKLNGKLASLNRFLAKSAEKSLPFFKTLKKCTKKSDFYWTKEAEAAFKQMKQLIAELPTLTTSEEKEELIVYLAAAKEAILFLDGPSYADGSRAGLILTNPKGAEFTYALRFSFEATNNEAEYEALIAGLRIAEEMGVKNLQANVDSSTKREVNKLVGSVDNSGRRGEHMDDPDLRIPYRRNSSNRGIDIAEPFPKGPGKVKFLIVAIDYFTKWIEAKPAHRTLIKSSNGDTPFSLTYDTEAVIPAEIGMPKLRTAEVDMVQNNEALEINMDLLKERRE